jgi:LDH2 family malate/lactate/ureidoglycolate dehydrogenase
MTTPRYAAADLVRFTRVLLEHAGLDTDKALAVADILVEGDLLGHDTHGLQLLPAYLNELQSGSMRKSGAPRVLRDRPAAITWDAQRLPGPWVVLQAIEIANFLCNSTAAVFTMRWLSRMRTRALSTEPDSVTGICLVTPGMPVGMMLGRTLSGGGLVESTGTTMA